jgi:hypothetical protein
MRARRDAARQPRRHRFDRSTRAFGDGRHQLAQLDPRIHGGAPRDAARGVRVHANGDSVGETDRAVGGFQGGAKFVGHVNPQFSFRTR